MKRITLLAVFAFVFVLSSKVQAQQILSHSTDQTTIETGVACQNTTTGITSQNSWWRSYVLADFGVTSDFDISGVQFAVGTFTAGTTDTSIDVVVTVYESNGAFPGAGRTSLGSVTKTITPADEGTLVYAELSAPITVAASSEIAIEVNAPAMTDGRFFLGVNTLGETAPSYLSSFDCSIFTPTATENIAGGFPDDFILNLVEDGALKVDNPVLAEISLYPNPVQGQLNITLPASVELETATMYDLLGQATKMNISENNTLNTANLAVGVYILKLETNQGTMTRKVIKQ